jgi:hypothetical protein
MLLVETSSNIGMLLIVHSRDCWFRQLSFREHIGAIADDVEMKADEVIDEMEAVLYAGTGGRSGRRSLVGGLVGFVTAPFLTPGECIS